MIRRLARYILRHEIESLELQARMWKQWALVQQRWREEQHGERPDHEGFRNWFFKTYPSKDDLPV